MHVFTDDISNSSSPDQHQWLSHIWTANYSWINQRHPPRYDGGKWGKSISFLDFNFGSNIQGSVEVLCTVQLERLLTLQSKHETTQAGKTPKWGETLSRSQVCMKAIWLDHLDLKGNIINKQTEIEAERICPKIVQNLYTAMKTCCG